MHRALTSLKEILSSKPQIQINSQPFLKCREWEILAESFFLVTLYNPGIHGSDHSLECKDASWLPPAIIELLSI